MTGGHGLGRVYSHIKALDSPNSHIKGNCAVKAFWVDNLDMPYACWGEHWIMELHVPNVHS